MSCQTAILSGSIAGKLAGKLAGNLTRNLLGSSEEGFVAPDITGTEAIVRHPGIRGYHSNVRLPVRSWRLPVSSQSLLV